MTSYHRPWYQFQLVQRVLNSIKNTFHRTTRSITMYISKKNKPTKWLMLCIWLMRYECDAKRRWWMYNMNDERKNIFHLNCLIISMEFCSDIIAGWEYTRIQWESISFHIHDRPLEINIASKNGALFENRARYIICAFFQF